MKKPLVINLAGAPGAGKSTGAAELFCNLKKRGYNCELVTEVAKDKTWEHNSKALSCQEYVFGKQSYRLARCRDDVDIIITDSPLPLTLIYNSNPILGKSFEEVVMAIFDTYENINFYINRAKPYNPKGRNQTESESDGLGEEIKALYDRLGIEYIEINGNDRGYTSALKTILKTVSKIK